MSGREWLDAGGASDHPADGNKGAPNKIEKTLTPSFIESVKDVRADRRCPHLIAGNCKKGNKCHYKHDVQELAADLAQLQTD
eukprot:15473445-Heterocapsa_arctica.AAC.1